MAALVGHALAGHFEQRNAEGGVEITAAAAHQPLVADLAQQFVEPVIVAEPDAHQQIGPPQLVEVAGPRLECFGIDRRRHDGLDGHEIAADRLRKCGDVGGGGGDAQACLRRRAGGKRRQRNCEERGAQRQRCATHVLFGTRQCTLFSAAVGAARRQSMTILARP
jgi:hypothetical protein